MGGPGLAVGPLDTRIWYVLNTAMSQHTSISIRRATVADAAGIAAVHVASWQWAYRDRLPQAYLDSLDAQRRVPWWERSLAVDPPATVFVAIAEEEVVGFCSVGPAKGDEDPAAGELHAIYLLEHFKGTGIGSALMDVGLDALRDAGYREAVLWVLDSNDRAISFYERKGWVDDGGRHTYELRDGVEAPAARYRRPL